MNAGHAGYLLAKFIGQNYETFSLPGPIQEALKIALNQRPPILEQAPVIGLELGHREAHLLIDMYSMALAVASHVQGFGERDQAEAIMEAFKHTMSIAATPEEAQHNLIDDMSRFRERLRAEICEPFIAEHAAPVADQLRDLMEAILGGNGNPAPTRRRTPNRRREQPAADREPTKD